MTKKGLPKTIIRSKSSDISRSQKDESSEEYEQDFYSDLDSSKRKNCCSLPAIIALLLLFFVALVVSLIFIKNHTQNGLSTIAQKYNSDYAKINDTYLAEANSLPGGQNATLRFSQKDIAAYLGITDSDFPLYNAALSIDQSGIHLSGRTGKSIFFLPVSAIVKPYVDQDKILLSIDSFSTGSISLPQRIKDKLNSYLDLIVRSRPISDERLEIISVTTEDGELSINFRKK